jgi:hypothetical protein
MNVLAHVTTSEMPWGALLFLAGFISGLAAAKLASRLSMR